MNKKSDEKYPSTAITSWSGFIYQGKVALLCCLRQIYKKFDNVKNYSLQLDSIDDFAILDDQNCISMHQVKAWKSNQFSSYRPEIKKQNIKAGEYPSANIFFHVTQELENIPSDFAKKFPRIIFYLYESNKNFCKLNNIDSLIEAEINNIFSENYQDSTHKTIPDYVARCREVLENIIVDKILTIHHKIHKSEQSNQAEIAYNENISFNAFIKVFEKELTNDLLNEDFFFMSLKKYTGIYFKEFCDGCINENNSDNDNLKKLNKYVSEINILNKKPFKKFICSILPHRKAAFSTLKEFHDNSFNGEDLKLGLFEIMRSLINANIDDKGKYPSMFYWNKENQNYYPTAIHAGQRSKNQYCESIINASLNDDLDFLYEEGNLVTVSMDCESIYDVAIGPSSHYEANMDYNKITSYKNVSLISIEKAEAILNA